MSYLPPLDCQCIDFSCNFVFMTEMSQDRLCILSICPVHRRYPVLRRKLTGSGSGRYLKSLSTVRVLPVYSNTKRSVPMEGRVYKIHTPLEQTRCLWLSQIKERRLGTDRIHWVNIGYYTVPVPWHWKNRSSIFRDVEGGPRKPRELRRLWGSGVLVLRTCTAPKWRGVGRVLGLHSFLRRSTLVSRQQTARASLGF